jgi:hypothetical protein
MTEFALHAAIAELFAILNMDKQPERWVEVLQSQLDNFQSTQSTETPLYKVNYF